MNSDSTLVLRAESLSKSYSDREVVSDLSLEIRRGEVRGLLGPNGAGKTTTVGMLYGAIIPDKGSVHLGPYQMEQQGPDARRLLGVVTQENNLDPDFTVRDNLVIFAHHYGIVGAPAQRRADELLELVGIQSHANYAVDELSGGLMRRLVLARALIHDPPFLFLDEPTTGLDPDARQDFWKLILELRSQGRAILLTTHYMEESERLCDRIALIREGIIIDDGSPKELIERVAGSEVIELEGVNKLEIRALVGNDVAWIRPVAKGYAFPAGENGLSALAEQGKLRCASRVLRRPANLDDVFFLLTGDRL